MAVFHELDLLVLRPFVKKKIIRTRPTARHFQNAQSLWELKNKMWWLIGSAPDFWGTGPGFESGIYRNDPDALQDHCAIL